MGLGPYLINTLYDAKWNARVERQPGTQTGSVEQPNSKL